MRLLVFVHLGIFARLLACRIIGSFMVFLSPHSGIFYIHTNIIIIIIMSFNTLKPKNRINEKFTKW